MRSFFMLVISSLLFSCAAMADANFIVPPECTEGVTGIDMAESGDTPVLTASYWQNGANAYIDVGSPAVFFKVWSTTLVFPKPSSTYFIVATYSPFLQSYATIDSGSEGSASIIFPVPGKYYNPSYHLFSSYEITIEVDGKPGDEVFVEMAPEFPGSSPYTFQTDSKGQYTVYCYTELPLGNPATVFDKENNFLFDTVIRSSNANVTSSATGGDILRGTGVGRGIAEPNGPVE